MPNYLKEKAKYQNEKPKYQNEKSKYQNEMSKYQNEKPKYQNEKPKYQNEMSKYQNEKPKYQNEKPKYQNENGFLPSEFSGIWQETQPNFENLQKTLKNGVLKGSSATNGNVLKALGKGSKSRRTHFFVCKSSIIFVSAARKCLRGDKKML